MGKSAVFMRISIIFCFLFITLLLGCKKENPRGAELDAETIDALQKVSQGRIFFGHQSVGANIVGGIQRLAEKSGGVKLNILELGKGNLPGPNFFAHGKIGRNESPKSKCDAFQAILRSGLGNKVDVALFKFCYIDIRERDNEKAILNLYKSALETVRSEYPKVKLIAVTVPLTSNESDWKYMAKKVLGRETERGNNIKRNQFNELLRATFKEEAVFDLAATESKRPDGSREIFNEEKNVYYSLVPEYSSDGSHLNDYGSQRAAKELILLLGKVISEKDMMHEARF
jgi:hypothetical protein